jgi:hypothetical protein
MGIYDAIKNTNIITIGQGSDYSDTVTVMQTKTGPPVDLTGYTVKSQLRTVTGGGLLRRSPARCRSPQLV